jgi:hypothetical protein
MESQGNLQAVCSYHSYTKAEKSQEEDEKEELF